ncbi:hypothetical protein CXB51_002272 [Gossypium anomalum]|uniref:hAT-like transposase RNase-H fold domain-containing protein n=1 Tax=Gossypium anomalum TaxID=47600 RepID=A0A8J5ZKW0_9ROSI|nr:hypothetical protein CXB51_002272 [Gossypium anomalum]
MKISNARDTTHERPTPEEAECLDDIEVATYTRRNRKKTSIVWQELIVVKLIDGTKKSAMTRQSFLPPQAPRFDNASGIQTWKYDQAKIREVISHMIMLFTLLMKTASPHYVRISRATAKTDCWTSYEVKKKRLNRLLKTVDMISITTDMWKVLNFVDMPPPHSGVVVSDALYKCLQDCGIEGKVCSIPVNNASYNDAVVAMLPLNGKLFHVRCCVHILNLLVHDGHSEIESVIDNVRENVKHIKASTVHLPMFNDIVKKLQLPNKRLILNFCTRWNATYAMLSCVLEFKDYLLSDEDWVRVEEVFSFLALFNEVANIIPSYEYPTSNLFFPDLWSIKDLYELYQEYVDEYAVGNVGTSMENDVQESGVSNDSTTSRIGKGKVMIERSKAK